MFIFSETFRFKYIEGQKQKIECTIQGEQYINGVFNLSYSQEYKTISTVMSYKDGFADLADTYYYYHLNKFYNYEVKEIKNLVDVTYKKDQIGRMIIKLSYNLPTLRNIPAFPEENIEPNYKWQTNGLEVQDLFGDNVISTFPIDVEYQFVGYEQLDNKNIAKFIYQYSVDITNDTGDGIDPRILQVKGISKTIMYFDNETGSRIKEEYERNYLFLITTDNIMTNEVEFVDKGTRIWHPIELMQKDDIIKDLKQELKDQNIENTTVEKDDKGIKISLENILFEPNSTKFLAEEEKRLIKIADILKKYKDRGVMIEGHTTDRGTEEGRKKLSLERSKVVGDFLIKENAIDKNKTYYLGSGGTKPIGDNQTEEGLKRNRRVEIYILED